MQIVEGLGTRAFARIGFPRPFRTVERNQWRKNCLLAYLRHFRLDGVASSKAEKFIIHQAIIVKEVLSDRAIRDDAHKRAPHVLWLSLEIGGLQQDQAIVNGPRSYELHQNAKQNVILASNVDRVGERVGLTPFIPKKFLPFGQHLEPMADLGSRGNANELFAIGFDAARVSLNLCRRKGAVFQAGVHKGEHLAENGRDEGFFLGLDVEIVDIVFSGLHVAAVIFHVDHPALIGFGVVQVRRDQGIRSHGAVTGGLHDFVNGWDGRRFQWRLAWTIENEPTTLSAEKGHDQWVVKVLFVDRKPFVIDTKHGRVQLFDVV